MVNQLKTIISTSLNPVYIRTANRLGDNLLHKIARIYFIAILGVLLSGIILTVISALTMRFYDFSLLAELKDKKFVLKHTAKTTFLLIVLMGPILEELIFRLFLKPTKLNVAIPLSIFFWLHMSPFFTSTLNIVDSTQRIVEAALSFLFFLGVYCLIKPHFIVDLRGKYFKFLYFFSCLTFGFIHFFNFQPLSISILIFSPFIVMPQLIYGFLIAYIRVNFKYGFFMGLLFHILINLPGRLF